MKIAYHTGDNAEARQVLATLEKTMAGAAPDTADAIVVLGGDGTMLEALHAYANLGKPFYGLNFGSVGFLMNPYRDGPLEARLAKAHKAIVHPLQMTAVDRAGKTHEAIAFNEVSLLRETRQAAKLKITVDETERIGELVCDGILLSTPAGSTAYNLSAQGPILPLSANVLALTPISAFRPRRWRGALLPCDRSVRIDVLESGKRPASVTADSHEFRDIAHVTIRQADTIRCTLLFDPEHPLEERILKEQFSN